MRLASVRLRFTSHSFDFDQMSRALITDAPTVWKLLNGVICVYKPAGVSVNRVRDSLLYKLSTELCQLECRPPVPYVLIEGDTTKPMKVTVFPSYADDPLVVGPRYRPHDFKCTWATFLGVNTSGVFVLGLNSGTKKVYKIHNSHPLRTYHVKGCLGEERDNLFKTGQLIGKSTFRHVRRGAFEKLLANIQASHQRMMYDLCGVDPQSQEAYDLAVKGLIRPTSSKLPLVYGIKCIDFDPPNFTIEVSCINEYEAYLLALVHDIGVKLHSVATCTGVRCIRHSYFSVEHALLKKHWTLQEVLDNLMKCKQLIKEQEKLSQHLDAIKKEQLL